MDDGHEHSAAPQKQLEERERRLGGENADSVHDGGALGERVHIPHGVGPAPQEAVAAPVQQVDADVKGRQVPADEQQPQQ